MVITGCAGAGEVDGAKPPFFPSFLANLPRLCMGPDLLAAMSVTAEGFVPVLKLAAILEATKSRRAPFLGIGLPLARSF